MSIQEFPYAKLNLTLDVTAKREDGYHDMVMDRGDWGTRDPCAVQLPLCSDG